MNKNTNNQEEERIFNSESIFGNARPREHVLSGRGIDWGQMEQLKSRRKSDFYHGSPVASKSWSGGSKKEHQYEKEALAKSPPGIGTPPPPPPTTLTPATSLSSCATDCSSPSSFLTPWKIDPFAGARPRESVLAERRTNQCTTEANKKVQKRTKSDPFAGARPRETVLADRNRGKRQDKNTPWSVNANSASLENSVRERYRRNYRTKPLSSSPVSSSLSPSPPAKKKANPFGDARPREVILAEQGIDYRLVDRARENKLRQSRSSGIRTRPRWSDNAATFS